VQNKILEVDVMMPLCVYLMLLSISFCHFVPLEVRSKMSSVLYYKTFSYIADSLALSEVLMITFYLHISNLCSLMLNSFSLRCPEGNFYP